MQRPDARRRKAAEFLLVLLLHGLFIGVVIRKSESAYSSLNTPDALIAYFIPRVSPNASDAYKNPISSLLGKSFTLNKVPKLALAPAIPVFPTIEITPTRQVDWQQELAMAARNQISQAAKDDDYRDLSKSLLPSQLVSLEEHRMEPANPGITWKSPRVEVTKDGLPIIHINDHCVLVPIALLPMVFCRIGHAQPNGNLFKHMHDPPPR